MTRKKAPLREGHSCPHDSLVHQPARPVKQKSKIFLTSPEKFSPSENILYFQYIIWGLCEACAAALRAFSQKNRPFSREL